MRQLNIAHWMDPESSNPLFTPDARGHRKAAVKSAQSQAVENGRLA
jgi:hypothetical protein